MSFPKSYNLKTNTYSSGQAVIASVIFLVLLSVVIIAGFATPLTRQLKAARAATDSRQSYYAAESGVEDVAYRIKNNLTYSTDYNFTLNGAVADINVATAGNTRTVNASGDQNNHWRLIEGKLIMSNVNPQFFYGAQVGEGGVEMGNGSQIKGVGGTVGHLYSNGPVVGFGSGLESTVTGDVIVATGVTLAGQSTACVADQIAGKTDPQIDFTQSFKAEDSKPLAKISLYLKQVGSPTTNRTVYITADNNGSPSTTSLGSGTLFASQVTGSYGWIDVTMDNPPTLVQNNTYWIILDTSQSNSKYWVWCRDQNNGYGNGVAKYKQDWNTAGSWTGITGDLAFKTYLGTGFSTLDKMMVYGSVKANAIINSKICGNAYYQNIDAGSTSFLNNPTNPCPTPWTNGTGTGDQADPPVAPLPISQANIDQWKTDAAAGGTCLQPQCDISGNLNVDADLSVGPKKILGNLNFTANGKTLTITGTTYVVGNVDISNNAKIICDSGYGSNSCVIVTDGQIIVGNSAQFQGSGQTGSYILLLTTKIGDATIELNNNALGAIMYAANGEVELENNVNATEVVGYKLELENGATITYEQGLLNSVFSSGPGISFVIDGWREVQ